MKRNIMEMERKYDAREAIKAIVLNLPDPELDDNTRLSFIEWLRSNGIELPSSSDYDQEADTPYSIRWAFFRASLEHSSARPAS